MREGKQKGGMVRGSEGGRKKHEREEKGRVSM